MENHKTDHQELNRRKFLKMAATLTAMAYMPAISFGDDSDKWGYVLPSRTLGKTGLKVTMFALGGGPPKINLPDEEAIVEAALKGGCRFFETARSYGTEPAYGNVLEPYRNEIILSSKSRAINAETLNRELDLTLKTLKTSYLDIYLMHNVPNMDVLKQKFDNGVFDAMLKAKQEGKVRHLGFSGHANPVVNNYMLDMNLPDLEVMLMPVNVIDTIQNSFTLNTLPKASEKNIGVMVMKPLGGGAMLGHDIIWGEGKGNKRPGIIPELISMKEAQHFVYSMPVGAASFGCTSVAQVEENIAFAKSYTGMSKAEHADLIRKVTDVAKNNLLEHYKGNN